MDQAYENIKASREKVHASQVSRILKELNKTISFKKRIDLPEAYHDEDGAMCLELKDKLEQLGTNKTIVKAACLDWYSNGSRILVVKLDSTSQNKSS